VAHHGVEQIDGIDAIIRIVLERIKNRLADLNGPGEVHYGVGPILPDRPVELARIAQVSHDQPSAQQRIPVIRRQIIIDEDIVSPGAQGGDHMTAGYILLRR